MKKSLNDLVREKAEQLATISSPVAILNDKSEELMEMERIIKSVYKVIILANTFLKKDWSADELKSLIEEHAALFLKNYGLGLCRYVSDPIINLKWMPFTSHATFLDFNELCRIEKRKFDEYHKTKQTNLSVRRSQAGTFKEIIDRHMANILPIRGET